MQLRELAKLASGPLAHPGRKLTSKTLAELDEAIEKKFKGVDRAAELMEWSVNTAMEKEQVYNVVQILKLIVGIKTHLSKQHDELDENVDPDDVALAILDSVKATLTPEMFVEIGLRCLSDKERKDAAKRLLAIETIPSELRHE